MKIIVTDTGRPEKQKIYMDWLQSYSPEAVLSVGSDNDSTIDLQEFDGLVLTGGEDVDPSLSKAEPVHLVQAFNRRRDDFEFQLLAQAMNLKMPVLGICRGLQVANVFFGGTLIADLPSAGFAEHTARKGEPEQRHSVTTDDGTLIRDIVKSGTGEINSYHHQSVLTAAEPLMVSGRSADGVIESMEWKDKRDKSYIMLVQWHPERMTDRGNPFTSEIALSFIKEAQKFNSVK